MILYKINKRGYNFISFKNSFLIKIEQDHKLIKKVCIKGCIDSYITLSRKVDALTVKLNELNSSSQVS